MSGQRYTVAVQAANGRRVLVHCRGNTERQAELAALASVNDDHGRLGWRILWTLEGVHES